MSYRIPTLRLLEETMVKTFKFFPHFVRGRPQSGRGGFVQCGYFSDNFFIYGRRIFGAKIFEFFEIYGVSAQTRLIFRDFVRTSFIDRPLTIY